MSVRSANPDGAVGGFSNCTNRLHLNRAFDPGDRLIPEQVKLIRFAGSNPEISVFAGKERADGIACEIVFSSQCDDCIAFDCNESMFFGSDPDGASGV